LPLTFTPEPEKTVIPTPAPATVAVYPTPELVAPPNGIKFSAKSEISFWWKWDGNLQKNEYFDVRIWQQDKPHYGKTNTQSSSWNVRKLSDLRLPGPGTYYWSVAVIRRGADGKWEKDLSAESPSRSFIYSSAGEGSSGGGGQGGK